MGPNTPYTVWYPTVVFPQQEQTALQRRMSSDLGELRGQMPQLTREFGRFANALTRHNHSESNIEALRAIADQLGGLANIHGTIQDGISGIGFRLDDPITQFNGFTSVLEWGFQLMYGEAQRQTDVLLSIEELLRNPKESKANEAFRVAQNLKADWVSPPPPGAAHK